MFEGILQIAQKYHLLNKINLTENTIIIKEKTQSQPISVKRHHFKGSSKSNVQQQTLNTLNSEISQKYPNVNIKFAKEFGKGDPFNNYGEIDKVFGGGKQTLCAKEGQVLLVDIWATWCGPCQKPMQHNQEMLEKNGEKWGDKVRIVGVSVDEELNDVIERVNNKNWTKVEHLFLGGWKHQHQLLNDFKISGIPFVFLVDSKGLINYIGHPSSIDLEQRINGLISGQFYKQQEGELMKEKDFSPSVQVNTRIQSILQEQNFNKHFGKAYIFSVTSRINNQWNGKKISSSIKLEISYADQDKNLLDLFKDLLSPMKGVEIIQKQIILDEIPSGTFCVDCKKEFGDHFYFWCKWDEIPNQFRCLQCGTKRNGNQFEYKNNSILTKGYKLQVARSRFGQNIQPSAPSQQQNLHRFICNGCRGGPKAGDARYICLGCRPQPNHKKDYIDLCETCSKQYVVGNEQIENRLNSDNHELNHPFLRVLYNVKGYYDF